MRLFLPMDLASARERIEAAATGLQSATQVLPLYPFRRRYGYNVYLVPDPVPPAHPHARLFLLDRAGGLEVSIRFSGIHPLVAIALFAGAAALVFAPVQHDSRMAFAILILQMLAAFLGIYTSVVGYFRIRTLRERLRALFPEARPAA